MQTTQQRIERLQTALPELELNQNDQTFVLKQELLETWDYASQAIMCGIELDFDNNSWTEIRQTYEQHKQNLAWIIAKNKQSFAINDLLSRFTQQFSDAWLDLSDAEIESLYRHFLSA